MARQPERRVLDTTSSRSAGEASASAGRGCRPSTPLRGCRAEEAQPETPSRTRRRASWLRKLAATLHHRDCPARASLAISACVTLAANPDPPERSFRTARKASHGTSTIRFQSLEELLELARVADDRPLADDP